MNFGGSARVCQIREEYGRQCRQKSKWRGRKAKQQVLGEQILTQDWSCGRQERERQGRLGPQAQGQLWGASACHAVMPFPSGRCSLQLTHLRLVSFTNFPASAFFPALGTPPAVGQCDCCLCPEAAHWGTWRAREGAQEVILLFGLPWGWAQALLTWFVNCQ